MGESLIYQEILEEEKQVGRLEGRLEVLKLVAQNLLSIGMTPAQVFTATGLTIGEVEELQSNP
jgi:predicted transposase/invertase (TIGR01784 family)